MYSSRRRSHLSGTRKREREKEKKRSEIFPDKTSRRSMTRDLSVRNVRDSPFLCETETYITNKVPGLFT